MVRELFCYIRGYASSMSGDLGLTSMTGPASFCHSLKYPVTHSEEGVAFCSCSSLAVVMAPTALRSSCTSMAFCSSEGSGLNTAGSSLFRSDDTDTHTR